MPKLNRKKSPLSDRDFLLRAINYWVVFEDMAHIFEQAKMPGVSQHLMAARQEIDKAWSSFGHKK